MKRDLSILSTRNVNIAIGILAAITNAHSLTATERERLEQAYGAIGKFLAEHPDFENITIEVHPQGSMSIGTTVRPEGKIEIDIDIVILLIQGYHNKVTCKKLLSKLYTALNEYAERHDLGIELKRRCVQLEYAGSMHADATPVVHHPLANRPYGLTHALVPDRELLHYQRTNPKGFGGWFGDASDQMPNFVLHRDTVSLTMKADVVPLPSAEIFDRLLARIVQFFKIHRNIFFANRDFCPASAFITTLVVKAYLAAVGRTFHSPLDLILDIWQNMPRIIERTPLADGRETWAVYNPTAEGDNLADRLNTPERQAAVQAWHAKFGEDFLQLIENADSVDGTDALSTQIRKSYGDKSARGISTAVSEFTKRERHGQRIHIPGKALSGAGTAAAPSIGIASKPHRFFGRD